MKEKDIIELLNKIEKNPKILSNIDPKIKNNPTFILAAIKKGYSFKIQYKDYRSIVYEAIQKDKDALYHVNDDLKNDPEIIFTAIKYFPQSIKYAGDDFMKNKKLICKAVFLHPIILKYLPRNIKNDPDVALMGILSNFPSLAFNLLPSKLRNSPKFVLNAIKYNPTIYDEEIKSELKGHPIIERYAKLDAKQRHAQFEDTLKDLVYDLYKQKSKRQ